MTARTPIEDLLVGGLDDWADAGWAVQSVRLGGETDPGALRDRTLELVAEALREGFVVAGDLVDGGHAQWQGEPQEWIERIRRQWLAQWGDEVPTPGAIVWLQNTQAGDEVARGVLAREASERNV